MTPGKQTDIGEFIRETLLYGVLVAVFCLAAVRLLGKPLQELFQHHRVEYAIAGLALMVAQGYGLERLAHAICTLFSRSKKGSP